MSNSKAGWRGRIGEILEDIRRQMAMRERRNE
jgi:hypothetical protein